MEHFAFLNYSDRFLVCWRYPTLIQRRKMCSSWLQTKKSPFNIDYSIATYTLYSEVSLPQTPGWRLPSAAGLVVAVSDLYAHRLYIQPTYIYTGGLYVTRLPAYSCCMYDLSCVTYIRMMHLHMPITAKSLACTTTWCNLKRWNMKLRTFSIRQSHA